MNNKNKSIETEIGKILSTLDVPDENMPNFQSNYKYYTPPQTVKSFSDFMLIDSCRSRSRTATKTAITIEVKGMTVPTNMRPGASSLSAIKTN